MKYVHNVYKVIDNDGTVLFRGSAKEIADQFAVTPTTVYGVAEGFSKHLLRRFTLEFDGTEVLTK